MEHLYRYKQAEKTVIALHGMGGNKEDMLALVDLMAPDHNTLVFDGEDFTTGMRRYFKRSATGLDLEDLKRVATAMAQEIRALSQKYGYDINQVDAFGFSNGANLLLGMVLLAAFPFRKVVALRPSVINLDPLDNNTQVRIHAGEQDPYMSVIEANQFMIKFSKLQANLSIYPGGHGVTQADIDDALRFFNA